MKFEMIPRFALRRNVTVLMSLIAILVIGFVSLSLIKLEFMPRNLNFPFMMVWVPYPNSTPEETEYIIADKVEAALNTIPFRKRSFANINSNGCFVGIELQPEADMDRAYMDMVDRIERLKPELPYESQRMRIRRARDGGDDDAEIFITTVHDSLRGDEHNFVSDFILKYFERIDGVATVDFDVAGQRSVYIYINNALVNSYNVNMYDVIQNLRQENFSISSGYIYEGDHKLFVRSRAKIYDLDRLRNLVINERGLKLKDIATISFTTSEQRWAWRIDGKPGMDIEIAKEPMANTIEVTDEIKRVVDELNQHPQVKEAGLKLALIFNKGDYIKQSVNNLLESGLWGGFFAFVFIYIFLRRFRMTAIITMAIPVSIFISIMCLYFMGLTLNGMTLMGLLLAVGLVVDNAIVIVENIYHKRREGLGIDDSAIQGTGEVGLAITLSTLTTVAIFTPILFLPDLGMGQYFKAIAIPVIAAMLASLIVAIIYIPYTSTRISSNKQIAEPEWTKRISRNIARVTLFFVKRRVDAFILFTILMAYLMFGPGPQQLGMGGGGNINDFNVMVELPNNYTFDQTFDLLRQIEKTVEQKWDDYQVKS
ncbi:MAG: efflux RND transporter permease subunit, partial [Calditrichaeota bacterium]|nr:efflux RND transporter permease subunit [Calditrichota bacterium]